MNQFYYRVKDKDYEVIVTYKRIKNIYLRFINDKFYISCSHFTLKSQIKNILDKYALKLINRNINSKEKEENKIYFMGEKYDDLDSGFITPDICYPSKEERTKLLEKVFANYVIDKTKEYAKMMNVTYKKVSCKHVNTRYGSYSKRTGNIYISYSLLPYSKEIIDSVIIHELAHILVFNHSKSFYDVIYRYYPDYDICHKKLKKGIYR